MATYDPVSTAKALAESYVYARQARLSSNQASTQAKSTALNSLKTALTTFTSALTSLSGKGGVVKQSATVSKESAASVTAGSSASAGNYQFEVKQLATAQQSLFDVADLGLSDGVVQPDGSVTYPPQPKVVLSLGDGGFFSVDLANADQDGDGKLSVAEVARAINSASAGKLSAAVMTVNGQPQLMLNAGKTGAEGAFKLHKLPAGTDPADVPALIAGAAGLAATQTLSAAQDAKIMVGGASGVEVIQSSNTYTGIAGLSIEFKELGAVGVTVAKDDSATQANMQGFVDAFNVLMKSLDKQMQADGKSAAGALAGDAGVKSLRNQLNGLLRTSIGGETLTSFGISAQRDGTISLDATRFAKKVAANPQVLDELLGQANTLEYKRTGVIGKLQTLIASWTSTSGGLLQGRQDGLQKLQAQYDKDQAAIERAYNQAYQRYLLQFSNLTGLEDRMNSTGNMLNALFTPSGKS